MIEPQNPRPAVIQWFCIRTKTKAEDLASINIARRDVLVFNPKIEELYRRSNRISPLFPGYIFANFCLSTEYYKVLWTPGVKQILGNGEIPIAVEDELIYLIMDHLVGGEYIRPNFRPGDRVRVKEGPFSELSGLFENYCPGNERVKVLLNLFDRYIEVELGITDLVRVDVAYH